jgi:multidrug resistance efflux pump
MLNRTISLCPYTRAIAISFDEGIARLAGISGLSDAPQDSPLGRDCLEIIKSTKDISKCIILNTAHFKSSPPSWTEISSAYPDGILWIPLKNENKVIGGLIFLRDKTLSKWTEKELKLLQSVSVGYAAAFEKLSTHRSSLLKAINKIGRKKSFAIVVAALFALSIIPLKLRIVAPCEVLAKDPAIVTAPMGGVIKEVYIKPGQKVPKGGKLYSYDGRVLEEELNVARQQVEIIRENLKRSKVLAFKNESARSEILLLENRLKQENTKLKLANIKYERILGKSPCDGIAVLDSPHEWSGKPVSVGERIMQIVTPQNSKLQIWLPEKDNIEFSEEKPIYIFLNVSAGETYKAKISYISKHVVISPKGVPSFKAEAQWIKKHKNMKIGLTGNAVIYGKSVPAIYWLLRRPLAAIRQYLGI